MILRAPRATEIPALADLWFSTWHEAHADHVPDGLIQLRTRASFTRRLGAMAQDCRGAWDADGPLGFCAVTQEAPGEIDQLFVAPRARGTGLAQRLLQDGEARLAAAGCQRPILKCLPENTKAKRFYLRHGWVEDGLHEALLRICDGTYPLPCLILAKDLGP